MSLVQILLAWSLIYRILTVTTCFKCFILSNRCAALFSLTRLLEKQISPQSSDSYFICLIIKKVTRKIEQKDYKYIYSDNIKRCVQYYLIIYLKGGSAPASNFLRSFRVSPEATALRLVLNNGAGSADVARRHGNLGRLIQSWNRFMLQQIHTDTEKREPDEEDRRIRKASENGLNLRSF